MGDIERTTWGEHIEFTAPEGFRWTLAHAPAYPFGSSMRKPHLGWVQVKAHAVTIIQDVTREDWGGIDMYINDVDGNPVQVVQFVTAT